MLTSLPVFDGKDRSCAYSFRTGYQAGRSAQGRFDPFATPPTYDRYWRIPSVPGPSGNGG
jgi:hypothetical protein